MIEKLLPETVAAADTRATHDPSELTESERLALGAASPGRAREFAAGRTCGRRALAALGLDPAPILRGAGRDPCWPPGVVGSITHTRGYCAAAAARTEVIASVGIDAEPHAPLPRGVQAQLALGPEARAIAERASDGIHWDRLLFSAKESVFKAWFPLAHRWLGFREAVLEFDRAAVPPASAPAGGFRATLLVPGPRYAGRTISGFTGRFLIADGYVLTTVAVPAARSGDRRGRV